MTSISCQFLVAIGPLRSCVRRGFTNPRLPHQLEPVISALPAALSGRGGRSGAGHHLPRRGLDLPAIQVTDRTMPPPYVLCPVPDRGCRLTPSPRAAERPTLREWRSAAIVGVVAALVGNRRAWVDSLEVRPRRVDRGDRAPVARWTVAFGRRLSAVAIAGLVIGFGGVALLAPRGGGPAMAPVRPPAAPQERCTPRGRPAGGSRCSASMQMLVAIFRHRRSIRGRPGDPCRLVLNEAGDRVSSISFSSAR